MLGAIILATSATDKNESTTGFHTTKNIMSSGPSPVRRFFTKAPVREYVYAMGIPFTDVYFETIMYYLIMYILVNILLL